MFRLGVVLFAVCCFSCGNDKGEGDENEGGYSFPGLSKRFTKASLPYVLTDTALNNNRDTASIRNPEFLQFISDSMRSMLFPRAKKISYIPLAQVQAPEGESYFIVKAVSSGRKAALLMTFDSEGNYAASLPFLVPDADAATMQNSSIDKSFQVSKNTTRKEKTDEIAKEGKEVFAYNAASRSFMLVLRDVLDGANDTLINPIDTLSRKHALAGDYSRGKRNLVSIRDGRSPNQLMAFVHFEHSKDCSGELKGDLILTSSKTAVYRVGGDPCVLEFRFSGNTVTLKEESGCGNHRGLNCAFEGSFKKSRTPKPRTGK